MGPQLEDLRRLQGLEIQLVTIRRTHESKTRQLEYHQKQVKLVDDKLQANKAQWREVQLKIDAQSLDAATKEEAIAKHRQALNKAKTNKEYAAILAAMNTEKADNTKVEDATLKLMEELAKVKAEGELIEAEKAKLVEQVQRADLAVKAHLEECNGELQRLRSEREALASGMNVQTVEIFNRVAARHDGEALATVAKPRPKRDEYICGGCNITVTLEVVNALQTKDDLQTCKVCGRILYLDNQLVPRPARA